MWQMPRCPLCRRPQLASMTRLRVIHVSAYYAPADVYGGPVRSIHALCRAQQANGMDVEVFTTNAAGSRRLPAAPDGRDVDGVRVRYFELSAPPMLLGAKALGPALRAALRDCDVVHLHGLFNRTVLDAAAAVNASGIPYVLSPRGMLEAPALAHHRWRKRVVWHLRDSAVVHRARVLHATSAFEATTLRRLPDAPQVIHVANTVDLAGSASLNAEAWRATHGIPSDAPLVLSLGRLHRIKRMDLVAAAFLQLVAQRPDAHLVIAGPDEQQLKPALERQLARARGAVHWVGAIGDDDAKQAALGAADVLIQCSDSESFGMSVAEALAACTPVVVTRTCPWHEIEEFGCGYWVEQRSDAIAHALIRIFSDRAAAAKMGAAGKRLIQERMSAGVVAGRWRAIYRDVAGPRSAAA
jgi:glycosyltransferase involved in cell wall biosynthesis